MRIKYVVLNLLLLLYAGQVIAADAPNITLNFGNVSKPLNEYKGKLVYLDFWASWCTPCRKSFPWMNEMYSKYHNKGLEILAVNLDKDNKQVHKFLSRYSASFKIAFDTTGKSAEKFRVSAMPTSFLIDRNGKIIMSHPGFRKKDKDKMEQLIQSNL